MNINPFLSEHLKTGIMQVGREHDGFGRFPLSSFEDLHLFLP